MIHRSLTFRIAGLIALLLCSTIVAAAQPAGRDRHVVVISLDGFPAYALADPTVPAPNLRSLARDGVMAAAMTPVNPTVTWPNHTTLVTGVAPDRHGVLFNGLPVRTGEGQPLKVEPHTEKTVLVQAPTVYDAAHAAGLTTAEVDWVAIERAPTITWSFAEWARPEGRIEREMVAAGLVTDEEIRTFSKAPITFRDEIWTRAAVHILKTHKPNLLLFHLLTTDSVQHRYGGRSLAGNTALALADAQVGRLIDACRVAGILPATTFIIVSDHGFRGYTRSIRPNALLAKQGLGDAAWVIPEGGTAMVYVTRSAEKAKTIETLRRVFGQAEGVARILTPAEFPEYGYPLPDKNERMADLVLAASDGFAFEGSKEGNAVVDAPAGASPGAHGFLNTDKDMGAIFIASGAGVKRGVTLGEIRNLDVAPTIARLLGLELKKRDRSAVVTDPAVNGVYTHRTRDRDGRRSRASSAEQDVPPSRSTDTRRIHQRKEPAHADSPTACATRSCQVRAVPAAERQPDGRQRRRPSGLGDCRGSPGTDLLRGHRQGRLDDRHAGKADAV